MENKGTRKIKCSKRDDGRQTEMDRVKNVAQNVEERREKSSSHTERLIKTESVLDGSR